MKKLNCKNIQNVSNECVVCGEKNPFSLFTKFYECEDDYLVGECIARDHHQSYPGRMHGGMISALIDETIGRAVQIKDSSIWGVTGELKVRFLKPVPLNEPLFCFGKLFKENSLLFKGVAVLESNSGELFATGEATYVKLGIEKIAGELKDEDWHKCCEPLPHSITFYNDEKLENLLKKE